MASGLRPIAAAVRAIPQVPRLPGAAAAATPDAVLAPPVGAAEVPARSAVRPSPGARVVRRPRRRETMEVARVLAEGAVLTPRKREMELLPSLSVEVPRPATVAAISAAVGGGGGLAARDLLGAGVAAPAPRREAAPRVPCVVPRVPVAPTRMVQALWIRRVEPLQVPTVGALQLVGLGWPSGGGPRLDTAANAPVRPSAPVGGARRRATSLEEVGVVSETIAFLPGARRAGPWPPGAAAARTGLLAPPRARLAGPKDPSTHAA